MDRPSSLYLFVKNQIEELIVRGQFMPGKRLPSEHELAKRYAVSRMTLREALRALEEEGLLIRRHGVGTFVATSAPKIKSILDVNYSVSEMIANMGFRPGTCEQNVEEVSADSHLAKHLNVKEGSKVFAIERVRTANDKPVVYSLDVLPASLVPDDFAIKTMDGSLYEFLETTCNIVLSSSMAKLLPVKAARRVARKLRVRMNSPVLLLEQVDTDAVGQPVLFSREYFVTDYFDFVIFRRRKK